MVKHDPFSDELKPPRGGIEEMNVKWFPADIMVGVSVEGLLRLLGVTPQRVYPACGLYEAFKIIEANYQVEAEGHIEGDLEKPSLDPVAEQIMDGLYPNWRRPRQVVREISDPVVALHPNVMWVLSTDDRWISMIRKGDKMSLSLSYYEKPDEEVCLAHLLTD